eukprot:9590535-Alexandrium_andersonii.AAC.1
MLDGCAEACSRGVCEACLEQPLLAPAAAEEVGHVLEGGHEVCPAWHRAAQLLGRVAEDVGRAWHLQRN